MRQDVRARHPRTPATASQGDTATDAVTGSDIATDIAHTDATAESATDAAVDSPVDTLLPDGGVIQVACTDALATFYNTPMGLPAFDPTHRGDIVRCMYSGHYSALVINGFLTEFATLFPPGYSGPALTSGATVYRIAYRTQRVSNSMVTDGISGALVMLPDAPIANPPPLVVVGHGTLGMAQNCAPSTFPTNPDPTMDAFLASGNPYLTFPLVGHGYAVVATDYAGFGFGSTSGWGLSEDEAHSLLDATRAVNNLVVPGTVSPNVVILGHSQGGHAVLSAQSYAGTYGLSGQLKGIVAFAPMWFPQRIWGDVLGGVAGGAPTINTAAGFGLAAFSMQAYYGHGEIYDGTGHGLAMMQTQYQSSLLTDLTTQCLSAPAGMPSLETSLPSLLLSSEPDAGSPTVADFFDPLFAGEVAECSALMFSPSGCFITGPDGGAVADAVGNTWVTRWKADRPAIDPNGAPILVWAGLGDTTIAPPLAMCGFQKLDHDLFATPLGSALAANNAQLTICGDPTADHVGVVDADFAYVNQWIATQTLGSPAPTACTQYPSSLGDGGALTCGPIANLD